MKPIWRFFFFIFLFFLSALGPRGPLCGKVTGRTTEGFFRPEFCEQLRVWTPVPVTKSPNSVTEETEEGKPYDSDYQCSPAATAKTAVPGEGGGEGGADAALVTTGKESFSVFISLQRTRTRGTSYSESTNMVNGE